MAARWFFRLSSSRRACLLTLTAAWCLSSGAVDRARGASFSKNDYGVGGTIDTANPTKSNFFRWESSTLLYAFDQSFIDYYGVAGENAVRAAFTSWNGAVAATKAPGADISAPGADPWILGTISHTARDLQSVALHEIGHVLGSDHPNLDVNYNVSKGDFALGALPGGSHPVMWSSLAANTSRRVLTNDDLNFAQFLYTAGAGGPSKAGIGGPVFGAGVPFTFEEDLFDSGGQVLTIAAGLLSPGTLADTIVGGFAIQAGYNYSVPSTATITFQIPEPATIILAIAGFVALILIRRRR